MHNTGIQFTNVLAYIKLMYSLSIFCLTILLIYGTVMKYMLNRALSTPLKLATASLMGAVANMPFTTLGISDMNFSMLIMFVFISVLSSFFACVSILIEYLPKLRMIEIMFKAIWNCTSKRTLTFSTLSLPRPMIWSKIQNPSMTNLEPACM